MVWRMGGWLHGLTNGWVVAWFDEWVGGCMV